MKGGVILGGRPRKDTSALQGSYNKDEMKKRVEVENKLKGKKDKIEAPGFIENDDVALEKFHQLVDELGEVDILLNVDVDLLAVYSDCWSKYIKATKMLTYQDMVEDQENKLGVVTRTQNPYIKIQNTYSDKLMKISSLFGLSPADRSKIAHLTPSNKNNETDPLMELIKGLKK